MGKLWLIPIYIVAGIAFGAGLGELAAWAILNRVNVSIICIAIGGILMASGLFVFWIQGLVRRATATEQKGES